ncbi:MAG TPA: hypothetical protein VES95_03420 [Dermatophilaceae bacterium]|nr:hypothetical protein [Dermatophilaceae bacterium]
MITGSGSYRLVRGAMQNWSDLAMTGPSVAPAVGAWALSRLRPGDSVLVVGAHNVPFVRALAQEAAALTVLARSIPDARTLSVELAGEGEVEVVCGSLTGLSAEGRTFDLVVSLDDLSRVVSVEVPSEARWEHCLDHLLGHTTPDGRLLLGVRNEMGIDSLASMRSRHSTNADADWAVLATHDRSRPRDVAQIVEVVRRRGRAMSGEAALGVFPSWEDPDVVAVGVEDLPEPLLRLLGLTVRRSGALRRQQADPARVVRAATASGRLSALASGWLVEMSPGADSRTGEPAAHPAGPYVEECRPGGSVSRFLLQGGEVVVQAVEGSPEDARTRRLTLCADCDLALDAMSDALASHDLPAVRAQLLAHRSWLEAAADESGTLPASRADATLDNVLRCGDHREVLTTGGAPAGLDDVLDRTLVDLVHRIGESGGRHPWPAAMGAEAMYQVLRAMAGLPPAAMPAVVGRDTVPPGDQVVVRHDVAGLLARIERLEETERALRGRAEWFERELTTRERQLRTVIADRERERGSAEAREQSLRTALADVKASATFRAGRAVLSPALTARTLSRRAARWSEAERSEPS